MPEQSQGGMSRISPSALGRAFPSLFSHAAAAPEQTSNCRDRIYSYNLDTGSHNRRGLVEQEPAMLLQRFWNEFKSLALRTLLLDVCGGGLEPVGRGALVRHGRVGHALSVAVHAAHLGLGGFALTLPEGCKNMKWREGGGRERGVSIAFQDQQRQIRV